MPPLDLDDERPRSRLRCIEREAAEVGDAYPVCGWVEGPIAEYTDLRGLELAMVDLLDEPDAFHAAAEHLVDEAVRFARVQIDAGADVIGIGDAAASIVGPQLYHDLVLPWEQKLIHRIHDAGALVKLHICGDLKPILADVVRTGADMIDLDWMVPIAAAREVAGDAADLRRQLRPRQRPALRQARDHRRRRPPLPRSRRPPLHAPARLRSPLRHPHGPHARLLPRRRNLPLHLNQTPPLPNPYPPRRR